MTDRFLLATILMFLVLSATGCSGGSVAPAPSAPPPPPPRVFTPQDLVGSFKLTISAQGCEPGFPEELKSRTYTATLNQGGMSEFGRLLTLRLDGAVFWGPNVGDIVYAWINPDRVSFVLDYEGLGSAILERPFPDTSLSIEGSGDTTYTVTGLSGTFDGQWFASPDAGRPASIRRCIATNHSIDLSK